DTMPLDGSAVRRGCRGAGVSTARQLCRAELEKFRAAAAGGEPLIVGCTQEAPLFSEVAGRADVTYANIRETAGWSKGAHAAGRIKGVVVARAARADPGRRLMNRNARAHGRPYRPARHAARGRLHRHAHPLGAEAALVDPAG